MNRFKLRQSLLLLLTATIWGFAFVAQSVSMDYIGPFTFNAVRNLIGGVVLIPCIWLLGHLEMSKDQKDEMGQRDSQQVRLWKVWDPQPLLGGCLCGVLLFVASNLQQFGIQYTTVGKAGFVTAMYIVIVPILGLFLHRRVGLKIWIGVVLAVAGLYLLCMTGGFYLQKGDTLVLLCALVFSLHILTVDHFAPKVDGVKMSCIQFFVCGLLSVVGMLLFEKPEVSQILSAWLPILYAGVLSCGVAYTLQIVGQKGLNPTVASLIMSLESVISALAGWMILGQSLSFRELSGCVLLFAAIMLVQLPEKKTFLAHRQ